MSETNPRTYRYDKRVAFSPGEAMAMLDYLLQTDDDTHLNGYLVIATAKRDNGDFEVISICNKEPADMLDVYLKAREDEANAQDVTAEKGNAIRPEDMVHALFDRVINGGSNAGS